MSGDDRPKKTFAERDRERREGRRESTPRGPGARARQERDRRDALSEADALFAKDRGGPEGDRLAKQMRDAHGTPDLPAACREYRETVGRLPESTELLSLFLDCGDRELVLAGLEALLALADRGGLEPSRGLKSQLRILAQGFDGDLADAAEELLEGL